MFSEKLKEMRTAKGWTQKQLAKEAKLPYPTVRDYEQGKRKPSWENVVKIAKALGVTPDAFLEE